MPLTTAEIRSVFDRYSGFNIYVRCRGRHNHPHSTRARVVGVGNRRVEIKPDHHPRTELVDPRCLSWWLSMMRKHHPDFTMTNKETVHA